MEDFMNVLLNQGFAVAMCTYTIVKVNTSISELTKVVTVLNEKIKGE